VPYESRGAAPDKVDDRGLNFDNLRDPPEPSGGHKTYLNKTYLNEALEKRQVEINKRMRDFNDAKVTPVLTIKHFKGVEQTIVPDLFHEAYAELRHENWVSPSINIHWEDEALVAYYADFPVGMITFVEQKFDKSIFIKMAYVRHNYRTQGVYRELYAKLREMAKERKVMLIIGVTDINNKPAQKAMEGVGRKAQYITYIDKLEDAL
jgi:GNAT superfamily N-acetyltransferase